MAVNDDYSRDNLWSLVDGINDCFNSGSDDDDFSGGLYENEPAHQHSEKKHDDGCPHFGDGRDSIDSDGELLDDECELHNAGYFDLLLDSLARVPPTALAARLFAHAGKAAYYREKFEQFQLQAVSVEKASHPDEYISELSRRASLKLGGSGTQEVVKARPTIAAKLMQTPLGWKLDASCDASWDASWRPPNPTLGCNDWTPSLGWHNWNPPDPEHRAYLLPKANSRPAQDWDSERPATPSKKRRRCEEALAGPLHPVGLQVQTQWSCPQTVMKAKKVSKIVKGRFAKATFEYAPLRPGWLAPVRPVGLQRPVDLQRPVGLPEVGLLEEAKLATLRQEPMSDFGGHFDFIEVGTSDWGTITQYCAGLRASESGFGGMMLKSCEAKAPPGSIVGANGRVFAPRGSVLESLNKHKVQNDLPPASTACDAIERSSAQNSNSAPQERSRKPPAARNRPSNARGLAVEAVQEHLAALPSLPHVVKVLAAMDEHCGVGTLYCVSGDNIARYMGRYHARLPGCKREKEVDVMWYAKSLSSLGSPQPELRAMLEEIGRLDFLEERRVHVLNWSELCRLYGVRSVDVVQIDCEGKDCAILRGLLAHCDGNRAAYPRLIMFEGNHLTKRSETSETIHAIKERGYRTLSRNKNNVVMERTWTP
mmetsp:Transcript_99471/g.181436  ORF Transcript_99471/g.181436 Transcript_99471/m.181436 type:complete len:652 (-) Transcript_99471:59-2014(-)